MSGTSDLRALQSLFDEIQHTPRLFEAAMPAIGRALSCHRTLLFLRDPVSWQSACTHGWWDKPQHAFSRDRGWRKQSEELAMKDPMFAEAIVNPTALYIDDIETAGDDLVNVEYERNEFGHRALIHAPLFDGGKCYGILEPCVFDHARVWSNDDRDVTEWLQARMGPLAAAYVAEHAPK